MPLTKTAPASRPLMSRSCSAGSFVQALDPSPKAVELATSMASSMSATRYSPATGPNVSSAYIRMSGLSPATAVGA